MAAFVIPQSEGEKQPFSPFHRKSVSALTTRRFDPTSRDASPAAKFPAPRPIEKFHRNRAPTLMARRFDSTSRDASSVAEFPATSRRGRLFYDIGDISTSPALTTRRFNSTSRDAGSAAELPATRLRGNPFDDGAEPFDDGAEPFDDIGDISMSPVLTARRFNSTSRNANSAAKFPAARLWEGFFDGIGDISTSPALKQSWKILSPFKVALMNEVNINTDNGVLSLIRLGRRGEAEPRFHYRRLKSQYEIRLLLIQPETSLDAIIRCDLIHARLPQCICVLEHIRTQHCPECWRLPSLPSYEAISYTWGDTSLKSDVLLNGHMISVTTNCMQALRRLRLATRPRLVWIDALCIDQNFLKERNHQIRLMNRIYRAASQVVIFLGEGNEATDLVMDKIRSEADATIDKPPHSAWLQLEDLRSILAFLTRPWFNRIWVLQEIAWSWSATIVCGTKEISWHCFRSVVLSLLSGIGVDHRIPYVLSFQRDYLDYFEITARTFFKHLCRARHCASTDPRDKVFALVPLALPFGPNPWSVSADYSKDVSEIYVRLAIQLLRSIGTEVLSAVQGRPLIGKLPSWVPDWTMPPQRTLLGITGRSPRFRAGGRSLQAAQPISIVTLDGRITLTIRGLHLDTIRVVEAVCDSEKSSPADCQRIVFNQWYSAVVRPDVLQTHLTQTTFPLSPVQIRDFWRTISLDAESSDDDIDSKISTARSTVKQTELDIWRSEMWPRLRGYGALELDKYLVPCDKRRFFITIKGYIGLAPPEAQVGDVVCIFLGARVPFILRRLGEYYMLVGECYTQGVMLGEAFTSDDLLDFKIV